MQRDTIKTSTVRKSLTEGYRKRSVSLWINEEGPVVVRHDPHWSGGTRMSWTFYALRGNDWEQVPRAMAGSEVIRKREDGTEMIGLGGPLTEITLHPGVIGVETGHFCGRTAMMRIIGQPQDIASIYR